MENSIVVISTLLLCCFGYQLPDDFDPAVNMFIKKTDTGIYHEVRHAAGYAAHLVSNGSADALETAEAIIDAVLNCQELNKNRSTYGNFKWMLEDKYVRDPNAVEFILSDWIPMMQDYQDRLSAALRKRVLDAIFLGLEEISSMDVRLSYTNMALCDVNNSSLGGELLGNTTIAERGYNKLAAWESFTLSNGTCCEYNSPTYIFVSMRALSNLMNRVKDEDTKIRARTLATRLALGAALRIHPATGRLAGPHSRAYQPSVVCERSAERNGILHWIENNTVPAWVRYAIDDKPLPMQVYETASKHQLCGLSTNITDNYAMGVATRRYSGQADVFMVHYTRGKETRPGVLYSRYLTNDKWLGDFYHPTDRSHSRNLIEEGNFFGVQSSARAIGIYCPPRQREYTSAKAAFILPGKDKISAVWIGDNRIEKFPVEVPDGEVVVVDGGSTLIAIRPLTITPLKDRSFVRLAERGEDIILELCNYEGDSIRVPRGNILPYCAFYAECADKCKYRDGSEFARVIQTGRFRERVRLVRKENREWTVAWEARCTRDGKLTGLEVDVKHWLLRRRFTQDGDLDWYMLESPVARQNAEGRVEIEGAILECGQAPAWLYVSKENNTYAAGYHGISQPLTLSVPGSRIEIESMGTGTVVWENGKVHVDAVDLQGFPHIIAR